METCNGCRFFFPIPETDLDHQEGKGDCVLKQEDQKGKFWTSRPVFEWDTACDGKKS